jgi:hypothetical protein
MTLKDLAKGTTHDCESWVFVLTLLAAAGCAGQVTAVTTTPLAAATATAPATTLPEQDARVGSSVYDLFFARQMMPQRSKRSMTR